MIKTLKPHIFFVDDEPKIRELVSETLEEAGFNVSCFATAANCVEQLRTRTCDLLISDVKLPGVNGIRLLAEAKRIDPSLPVVLVTGYGDVPMAVRAIKAGACDFIEKPVNRQGLLWTIEFALKQVSPTHPLLHKRLTHAEMRVLRLILDGNTNKEIGRLLHRSESTVAVHRKHIMRKLGVHNAVDLIKRAAAMGLSSQPAEK